MKCPRLRVPSSLPNEPDCRVARDRRKGSGPIAATGEHRINDRIRVREVRLVGPDGTQLGIKPAPEALSIARDLDLDLVEVAPTANPPVCRIMDYGKFKFDEAQKAKESRRKSLNVGVKEMKYRPKIGPGDFDTKTRQVAKFLKSSTLNWERRSLTRWPTSLETTPRSRPSPDLMVET